MMNMHSAARHIAGYTLIGSVLTGALLGWIPSPFDIHYLGIGGGVIVGILSLRRSPQA